MSSNRGKYHQKATSSGRASHERAVLRLVQGPGVIPTPAAAQSANHTGPAVETGAGDRSLADVLAERGRLGEAECRDIGSGLSAALSDMHERGIVHGGIKPASIVIASDGNVRIADSETAQSPHEGNDATLARRDDIVGVALVVAKCATGILIDRTAEWSTLALMQLGCSDELAHDLAAVLTEPDSPRRLAALGTHPDDRLRSPAKAHATDAVPTIDFESTAIAGLDPLPSTIDVFNQPNAPEGWQEKIQRTLSEWLSSFRKKRSELTAMFQQRKLTNRGG